MKDFPKNIKHENDYAEAVYEYLGISDGFFVDVGAFDGVKNSKTLLFEEKGWDGLCIEPHPTSFEKLKKNRSCAKKNVLISFLNGYSKFWYSEKAPMTSRVNMSGIKKRIHRMDDRKKLYLKCFKLNCLCKKLNISRIDFLKIDAEGHDARIINSIDFDTLPVSIIMYEQWAGQEEAEYKKAERKLEASGYSLIHSNGENKIWSRI